MVQRRAESLGPSYRLFYNAPLNIVRGDGVHLYDADGQEYLDCYNNVASIGHAHRRVVQAIAAQASTLNTHTRYLGEPILDYAENLLSTLPAQLDRVMFVCTGSEANDLALRVAFESTGGTGVVVTDEAYHGTTALVAGASPATGSGQPLNPAVRTVPPPDAYRGPTNDPAALGAWFAANVDAAFADLARHGYRAAAFLADSIFSSDGVYTDPRGVLAQAVDATHRHGAVFIADEVQPGFARTGDTFWGFARHGVIPDMVTMGKPMGNGMPIAALAASAKVLAPFGERVPYFNTFGGNPVSIAAAAAVLDVIEDEGLQENSRVRGAQLRQGLAELYSRHELIGDIRGAGLYAGVELVSSRGGKEPAPAVASAVINAMRDRRVLISVCGPHNSTLKIRPLLISSEGDISRLLEALDATLSDVARSL
ncbi:aspartate aminotransferase family protein [Homoserinibacter sp. GY 40078]|uniref:aspartate aminotransferase family protein n=1 Tax=Homoserinibacter sp. GY 40078 TaxID=2603275 RepID=UPI0011CBAA65|nr:aspartate aminotransferase family protein [Homoserinibacter sp. GY 40078]TXK19736.1 aspartate aminotransferase family protein [Homoserinibacter sp. GY 40078]